MIAGRSLSKKVMKVISKRQELERGTYEIVDTEILVPQEHLLRKIDKAVGFEKIYEMVEELYCSDNGRPSIDPVVLFKMVIIQLLYGIPSLRRTAAEVRVNVAYRWFLGYKLTDETPHFSTLSYNFKNRFTAETIDKIFAWILSEISEAGYLLPSAVFIDGTHIKANANNKKKTEVEISVASKRYAKELMKEINADREEHGKKPFDDDNNDKPNKPNKNTSKKKLKRLKKQAKTKKSVQSTTDPESGLFVKGEHKRQFAYETHTAFTICVGHIFIFRIVLNINSMKTHLPNEFIHIIRFFHHFDCPISYF